MADKKIAGLHRNVFFSGLVSFFMDLSSEMIYPLVPIFLSSVLGVNKTLIGVIEGIAESTASLLKVFSGWFSDRLKKRKPLIIAGYSISTLGRPVLALAASWAHVLIFRFIDRFGKGIRTSPRDAVIAESTPAKDLGRSFGFHRAMDTCGAVAGPAAAFLILSLFSGNFRLVFWLSLVPGIMAVFIIILFIRETKARHVDSPDQRPDDRHPLSSGAVKEKEKIRISWSHFNWRYKMFVGIAALFAVGNSSDVFLILRASNIGIEEMHIPLLYLSFNIVYSLVSLPAGILSDRIGRKRVILSGFIIFSLIYLGFALSYEKWHIWGLFLFYGVFMGLTEGVQKAYLATVVPLEFRATGFGFYHTLTGLAMLPASMIGGYLWDAYGPHATFYFGTCTAFISALLFLIVFGIDTLKTAAKA